MAQGTVRAPFLRQFNCRSREVSMVFLQLVFEARKKRQSICRAAGESRENFIAVEPPRLFRAMFDHALAQRDLSIRSEHNLGILAHTQHRGAAYLRRFLAYLHPAIIPSPRAIGESQCKMN